MDVQLAKGGGPRRRCIGVKEKEPALDPAAADPGIGNIRVLPEPETRQQHRGGVRGGPALPGVIQCKVGRVSSRHDAAQQSASVQAK